MPIQTLCKRPPECGRIRMGEKGVSANGKTYPKKLEQWRLTSANRVALEAAAKMWGGTVKKWEEQWELVTKTAELPVLIAPVAPSQFYELWSAGGCQRRCDGVTAAVPDGRGGIKEVDCICDPEKRDCKFHTRASFFLEDLPAFGVWRVESGGYYAATEFYPAVEILEAQARQGNYPRAILAIEKRSVKRENTKGETETRNFIVPVLRIEQTLREILSGVQPRAAISPAETPRIPEATTRALPASPSPTDTNGVTVGNRKAEWEKLVLTKGFRPALDDIPACCEFIGKLLDKPVGKLNDLTADDLYTARMVLENDALALVAQEGLPI